jgi:hypothetical protein
MSNSESPPGFVVRTEAQKAAFERGFRIERGFEGPWIHYASTTAPTEIWIAGGGPAGPWFLAIDHRGVATEFGPGIQLPGPGVSRYVFPTLIGLYDALNRTWRLARSLPTAPLAQFEGATAGLPRATEVERLTVQRVGQDIFRAALLDYWGGRCPLTGITDSALLRASHIVPWAECDTDAQRLDVHNGLLLSALWDAAFDAGLVSFADDGTLLTAVSLSAVADGILSRSRMTGATIALTAAHQMNMRRHRSSHGFSVVPNDV